MTDFARPYRPAGRRAFARHGRLRRRRAAAAVGRFLAVALCVCLISGGAIAVYAGTHLASAVKTFHLPGEGGPKIVAAKGAVNLLLIGDDTRNGQKGHYGANPGSALNDVDILMHISADHTKATVISIPRDTYLDVPACTNDKGESVAAETGVKLNSVLSYGGLSCIRATVSNLTGMHIPYVAEITFDGVVAMSNAVGGVPVCVASPINDTDTDLHLSKGEHTLKGATALKFLRTRHGVGDGSDLSRISSQQVFLSSLVRQLKAKSTLTDPLKVYAIADAATQHMTLSDTLGSPAALASIAGAFAPISLSKVVFVQFPTTVSGDGVIPNTELDSKLLDAVKADKTISLSKNTGEGSQGSVVKSTPSSKSTPAPSATSSGSSDTTKLPSGVLGQTAEQQSCSVGNG